MYIKQSMKRRKATYDDGIETGVATRDGDALTLWSTVVSSSLESAVRSITSTFLLVPPLSCSFGARLDWLKSVKRQKARLVT